MDMTETIKLIINKIRKETKTTKHKIITIIKQQ